MISKNFRIYEDNDGKKYRFNSIEFAKMIEKKSKESKNSGNPVTQKAIMDKMAEKTSFSFEAIRHWKQGENAPSTLESVKECAFVLGTDYHNLLTALDDQEESTMSEKEKKIVEDVYRDIINILYEMKTLKENAEGDYDEALKGIHSQIGKLFTETHKKVDASSLNISDEVRYKLHRILMEMQDYLCVKNGGSFDERWFHIENEVASKTDDYAIPEFELNPYIESVTRKEGIYARGAEYIFEETNLAEKLGKEATPIPQSYLEDFCDDEEVNRLQYDELAQYGFVSTDNGVLEITPQIIFIDQMIKLTKDIFKHDFPGIIL